VQQSSPHGELNLADCRRSQAVGRVKGDAASRIAREYAIHHNAMKTKFQWRLTPASSALSAAAVTKVQMGAPQRAEAVDEDHSTEAVSPI